MLTYPRMRGDREIVSNTSQFQLLPSENSLRIIKANETSTGLYRCSIKSRPVLFREIEVKS